jgi:hypothetical protein
VVARIKIIHPCARAPRLVLLGLGALIITIALPSVGAVHLPGHCSKGGLEEDRCADMALVWFIINLHPVPVQT